MVMHHVTNVALEVHSAVLSVLLVILRVGNCFLQNTIQNLQYQMFWYMQGVQFIFAQSSSFQLMWNLTVVTDVLSLAWLESNPSSVCRSSLFGSLCIGSCSRWSFWNCRFVYISMLWPQRGTSFSLFIQ